MSKTVVYASDGSNSHPTGQGPAGAAFVIDGADPHYFPMETGTNNEAEMHAFVKAVSHASAFCKAGQIVIQTDSQWVAYTVAGYLKLNYLSHYKIDAKNAPRFKVMLDTIQRMWKSEVMTLKWVRREENKEADKASKIAREQAMKMYVKENTDE